MTTAWNMVPPSEWLDNEYDLSNACSYLYNSTRENGLGFDTETTGLNINRDFPLMLSFSDGIRRFAFLFEQFGHHPWVTGLLGDREIAKVATNIKFDKHMLANAGVELRGPHEDTVVMDWLHDENRWGHGLKETAHDYLRLKMREFKEVFPMRKATKRVPGETAGDAIRRVLADPAMRQGAIEYSGLDPYASMNVRKYLRERLRSVSMHEGYSLWDHFKDWEVPFTEVLWACERRGFTICTGHLKAQTVPMEAHMAEIEGQIAQMAGWVININSTHQLRKLFFEQLKYTPVKMTDGGTTGNKQPSTDEDVLNEFAANGCPFSKLIISHRKISKIYGTYIMGMLGWVDQDLRIHTTLNQAGTVTGRLSSKDPNLQNIPRPATDKWHIREAFVAAPGKRLIVADYDQLEMKLMAHFSGDRDMCQAIISGKDLHCFTVALMYNQKYEEVFAAKKSKDPTPEQKILLGYRQAAKVTGFGLIYGIGAKKLAAQLTDESDRTVTKEDAQALIKKYFGVFPGVESFIKGTHKYCQDTEYVQTLMGRFRRLPQINAKGGGGEDGEDGKGIAAEAKRQAVNSIIQGTAADVAKAAMLRVESDEELKRLGAQMLMQIHDELILEIDDDPEIEKAARKRVVDIMENPFGQGFQLNVPLTVGSGSGYTWAESK